MHAQPTGTIRFGLLGVAALLLLVGSGCGNGGWDPPVPRTGIMVHNNQTDSGGFPNTQAVTHVLIDTTTHNVNIAPGQSAFFAISAGSYNVEVTYADATNETTQTPPDPVPVIQGQDTIVDMVY